MRSFIGVNDPQAVKKWASALAVAVVKESYFGSKMVGSGSKSTMPIQRLTELEKGAGDEVTVDLLMPMNMEPIIGDDTLSGKEQRLKYYTDRLRIDQVRGGTDMGSRMTRKRTLRNYREDALRNNKDWWARLQDELYFIYLSGARGVGYSLWSAASKMFAVNPLTAPDAMHQMYAGTATSKASLTTADTYNLRLIDRAVAKAETMGGDGTDELSMVPITIEGGKHYVNLMHTFQFDAMKSNTAVGQWLDIQKAAAAAQGQKSPIFVGSPGMYNDVVLHKHRNVVRFSDYGASTNLPAGRALFLGAQAAFIATGDNESGARYKWTEEKKDHENSIAIGTHCIMGVKKATYKSKDGAVSRDFGVIAIDSYMADPNP